MRYDNRTLNILHAIEQYPHLKKELLREIERKKKSPIIDENGEEVISIQMYIEEDDIGRVALRNLE